MSGSEELRGCFARAIEDCRDAWRQSWEREPTLNELTHPFGIVLSASPGHYARDPSTVAPARPHIEASDPAQLEARFAMTDPRGFDVWSIVGQGRPILRCETSISDDHLRIELERAPNVALSDAAAVKLAVTVLALPAMRHYRRRIRSVTVVPLDSLGDPVRIGAAR